MHEAVGEQKVNQECLLGKGCDIREVVPVVLREPDDFLHEKLAVLLAEKLVPNLERADFHYLRAGAFGARLAMRLVLADNEARNVTVQLKDPALAMLLPAFVEPRVKAGVVPAKALEDGVGLVYLIRFRSTMYGRFTAFTPNNRFTHWSASSTVKTLAPRSARSARRWRPIS